VSDGIVRGRLLDTSATPAAGERIEEVLLVGNVVVEQVLSGEVEGPVDYLQEQDEWVVVVSGAAVLEVGGRRVDLASGDWVLLPGNLPHRLVSVEPGTNWLGVHVHAGPVPRAGSHSS
jgi:cupin 2 domain-containing protein